MKTLITLAIALFISISSLAQTRGVNYKAIIKDGSGNVVANDLIQVQFEIRTTSTTGTVVYAETHSPTTDDNGAIVINIGEGALVSGSGLFSDITWGSDDHFLNVQVNIGSGLVDLGTTEFKTVPYALSTADKAWQENSDDAYKISGNIGIGTDAPTERLTIEDNTAATIGLKVPDFSNTTSIDFNNGNASGLHSFYKLENRADEFRISIDSDITTAVGYEEMAAITSTGLKLQQGTTVNEFSTDGNLTGNSNTAVPTEQAVKTYVDEAVSAPPIVFKVRGNGFAVKDIDGGTEVETDIWDIEVYDPQNAFNATTKRFVAPESGYYYLHAVIRQSNFVTPAFFRIRFNIDTSADYNTIVDGDDVKTEVSGIYFLNAGQQVYVLLRNYSVGEDERMDGTGSWFEGYKID